MEKFGKHCSVNEVFFCGVNCILDVAFELQG